MEWPVREPGKKSNRINFLFLEPGVRGGEARVAIIFFFLPSSIRLY